MCVNVFLCNLITLNSKRLYIDAFGLVKAEVKKGQV